MLHFTNVHCVKSVDLIIERDAYHELRHKQGT